MTWRGSEDDTSYEPYREVLPNFNACKSVVGHFVHLRTLAHCPPV